ncbi:MAG: o-succinylbenzoate synthase [Bacteroidales bacterium]|jgi:L-alanine-DL-glutamate epimerase-like enolase superfamily enzyme|nr:o-succinylbenzoate synthase [Bacteroidales bacterium]
MLKAVYMKKTLLFKEAAVTSRGVMMEKGSWFVKVWDEACPERFGLGECALFPGLGAEEVSGYETRLKEACARINDFRPEEWRAHSSICFGMETALADLRNGGVRTPFPSAFTRGEREIEINGLVWMGSLRQMMRRAEEKLEAGFRCLKLKIGGIDFHDELELLRLIRSRFPAGEVQLRVDANGAFTPREVLRKLEQLARYELHSVEQPVRPGQWQAMGTLCRKSPVPVALDEDLIGITSRKEKIRLLETAAPRYIVLKPALAGGFAACDEWIALAGECGAGWWITSALESDVGLNAIAQWCATKHSVLPQGLGTGQLYRNNIPSPLLQRGSTLAFRPEGAWDLQSLTF